MRAPLSWLRSRERVLYQVLPAGKDITRQTQLLASILLKPAPQLSVVYILHPLSNFHRPPPEESHTRQEWCSLHTLVLEPELILKVAPLRYTVLHNFTLQLEAYEVTGLNSCIVGEKKSVFLEEVHMMYCTLICMFVVCLCSAAGLV